jgi:hypothetical protein
MRQLSTGNLMRGNDATNGEESKVESEKWKEKAEKQRAKAKDKSLTQRRREAEGIIKNASNESL